MSDETQDKPIPESGSGHPKPSAAKAAPKTTRARAKSTPAGASAEPAPKAKPSPKPRKKSATRKKNSEPAEAQVNLTELVQESTAEAIQVPADNATSTEALNFQGPGAETESAALMEAYRADTTSDAEHGLPEVAPGHLDTEDHPTTASSLQPQAGEAPDSPDHAPTSESQPAGKLERLQKILSQAGVASRRHAEEMIVEGRVVVNGQVVTTLGAKADSTRDHIRVDGKLIHGPERHRTFVLNKPKGYVTTLDDPEGRPTVTQFFTKTHERLYPVGRLDYQSEGLLLMTNDGELAHRLTRAASELEKTYLVKVAGRPTEEELDRLRSGVPIERGASGSDKVVTAPAQIRQVRQGDNPWYEVILIEGRNRELRKMFQSIGHFVEKIRRVGYGPLVLDVEPGKFRELTAEELSSLQLAAEGKLKPRRPKDSKMPSERPPRSAERFERTPPVREGKSRPPREAFGQRRDSWGPPQSGFRRQNDRSGPPRTAFGSRGDKSGPPQTGFRRQEDRSRPPRKAFGQRSDRSGPPQAGSRPRSERPYRDAAPSRQENQRRFDNRGIPDRDRREESSLQPQPGRPRRQYGEHTYLHGPEQPQSRPPQSRGQQSRPPQSRFDKPRREDYGNRSDRGFSSRPPKPWAARPERDQRQNSGNRSGRPSASGSFSRRPPGRPSRPGGDGQSNRRGNAPENRRGPARGPGNRFRKPGR